MGQGKQVLDAGHERVGLGGNRQFEEGAVEGIPALRDGGRPGDGDRFAMRQVVAKKVFPFAGRELEAGMVQYADQFGGGFPARQRYDGPGLKG